MFETIKRIFGNTKNEEVVLKALEKGWITEEQKNSILEA